MENRGKKGTGTGTRNFPGFYKKSPEKGLGTHAMSMLVGEVLVQGASCFFLSTCDLMWSSNISEAEAAAAFALSSPDQSTFGNSPAGRALRKAREASANEAIFLAAFEDSPAPPPLENEVLFRSDKPPSPQPMVFEEPVNVQPLASIATEDFLLNKIAQDIKREEEEEASDPSWNSEGLASPSEASGSFDDEPDEGVYSDDSEREKPSTSSALVMTSGSGASRGPMLPCSRTQSGSSLARTISSASGSAASSSVVPMSQAVALLSEYKGELSGNLKHQREVHNAAGSMAFAGFTCSCDLKGVYESCLETGFDRPTFRSMHRHTYGRYDALHTTRQCKAAVHSAVWELRKPLPAPQHEDGHLFKVPEWRLGGPGGKVVCKKAFIAAIGGTANAHREALTLTIAGKEPSDAKAYKAASLAVKQLHKVESVRGQWAQSWWKQHLMWQDWLPNEMSIQYRGPTWEQVYKDFYLPNATRVKLILKPKQWMRNRNNAVAQLQAEWFPHVTDQKLTVVRSARHSKFPECTDCQKLRTEYKKLACNPRAPTTQISAAYQKMAAHANQWQQDRETAIDLRRRYSNITSTWRYSVDDKCGSFWQAMPVSITGRDTKENAKNKYRFAVHANVVCGEGGHKQFTFVPKNISTGANFGLTNLLMTIFLAIKTGNLKPDTKNFIRHTDGGPDNVSVVTHFTHWLLVYLGVFDTFEWFRFKAGHSHTEVADRLFSIIKRLFESDGAHRVNPIESFPDLIGKIEHEFQKEAESCIFNWNFANWDLRKLMAEMNCVSSKLSGISSKMVYQYTFVEALWEHGCVLVQYKSNISWTGNARDAEWSPLTRVTKLMNVGNEDGEPEPVECNVSRAKGVRFVSRPPDLRIRPRLEPFDQKADKFGPDKQCSAVLNKRSSELSAASKSFWKCLSKFHSVHGDVAERVPDMPHTINTEEHSFTFDGSPRPFVDVMKAIMRFPRPLLPSDPFTSEPAESWEDALAKSAKEPCGECSSSAAGTSSEELRDPRRENTVTDLEHTEAARRKDLRALAEEEFAEETPTRVEEVILEDLYLCELEEAEHGLRLGLGMPIKKGPRSEEGQPTWTVEWFKIQSKKGWKTKCIKFEEHKLRGKRQTDDLETKSFRLHIDDSDLTKAGKEKKNTEPKFTGGFTEKVLAFARSEKLDEHETEDEMEAVTSGSSGDEDEPDDLDEADDFVEADDDKSAADAASDQDDEDEVVAPLESSDSDLEPSAKKARANKGKAPAAAVAPPKTKGKSNVKAAVAAPPKAKGKSKAPAAAASEEEIKVSVVLV